MAQRVVIATSLICEPEILIADEPTTGLDATVQRQILDELAALQEQLSLSVLMITHDLAIVAQYCDWVSVMNLGRVVEDGPMRTSSQGADGRLHAAPAVGVEAGGAAGSGDRLTAILDTSRGG